MPLPPPVMRTVLFLNSSLALASKHKTGPNLGSHVCSLDVRQNLEPELKSPTRSAAGDDVAVLDNAFLDIFCSLCDESLLKSVVAGHLLSCDIRQLAQNEAWSSADGSYGA